VCGDESWGEVAHEGIRFAACAVAIEKPDRAGANGNPSGAGAAAPAFSLVFLPQAHEVYRRLALDPGASRHPLLDAFHSRFRNVGLWLLALPSRQTPQVPTVSRGRLRSNTLGAFYGLR